MLTLLNTNRTIESKISLTFPLAVLMNKGVGIFELLLFSHCLHCHCSAFLSLCCISCSWTEHGTGKLCWNRPERKGRKEKEFWESAWHLGRTRWHVLVSVLKILRPGNWPHLWTLDELLIEWTPGNWWLCGLGNNPKVEEYHAEQI